MHSMYAYIVVQVTVLDHRFSNPLNPGQKSDRFLETGLEKRLRKRQITLMD